MLASWLARHKRLICKIQLLLLRARRSALLVWVEEGVRHDDDLFTAIGRGGGDRSVRASNTMVVRDDLEGSGSCSGSRMINVFPSSFAMSRILFTSSCIFSCLYCQVPMWVLEIRQ